jgi:hypothetical protein
MAKVFDITQPAHDDEKLTGSIRDSRKQTISHVRRAGRPLLSGRNRAALTVARAEVRELRRLLYRSELSIKQVSSITPGLLRFLVKREIMFDKIFLISTIIVTGITVIYLTWGNLDDPKLVFSRIVVTTLVGIMTSILLKVWTVTDERYIRRL